MLKTLGNLLLMAIVTACLFVIWYFLCAMIILTVICMGLFIYNL